MGHPPFAGSQSSAGGENAWLKPQNAVKIRVKHGTFRNATRVLAYNCARSVTGPSDNFFVVIEDNAVNVFIIGDVFDPINIVEKGRGDGFAVHRDQLQVAGGLVTAGDLLVVDQRHPGQGLVWGVRLINCDRGSFAKKDCISSVSTQDCDEQ